MMTVADVAKMIGQRLDNAYHANTERLVRDDHVDIAEQRGVCRGIALSRDLVAEIAKRPTSLQDVV